MEFRVTEREDTRESVRCPYCHDTLHDGTPLVFCINCKAASHKECTRKFCPSCREAYLIDVPGLLVEEKQKLAPWAKAMVFLAGVSVFLGFCGILMMGPAVLKVCVMLLLTTGGILAVAFMIDALINGPEKRQYPFR